MAKKKTEQEKMRWLYAYESAIRTALAHCKKQPTWQHLPAGHMRMAQGANPAAAARAYLAETIYGRQSCAKLAKTHR